MRLIDADALIVTDDACREMTCRGCKNHITSCEELLDLIRNEPTIKSERKSGKWIPVNNGRGGHECNQCHNYAPAWQTGEEHLTNFCPNCGADMRGGDTNDND